MSLPPPEQRIWLLEQLSLLLEVGGRARFLSAPLLQELPSSEAEGQLRALLGHLRMDEVELELEPVELELGDVVPGARVCGRGGLRALWLIEDQGSRLRWGLRGSVPPDPASLCHEIAHLWRARRGLVVDDPQLEELLTELTAVYLGFGPSTVEGARQRRAAAGGFVLESRPLGALEPESLCFVLAAQLAARDPSERQLAPLLEPLSAGRAASVREALRWFRRGGRRSLEELLAEEPEAGQLVELPDGARPVQRLRGHLGYVGSALGSALGLALALLGLAAFAEVRSFALLPLCGIVGALAGWSVSRSRCSACRTNLGEEDVLCPGCGGLITEADSAP